MYIVRDFCEITADYLTAICCKINCTAKCYIFTTNLLLFNNTEQFVSHMIASSIILHQISCQKTCMLWNLENDSNLSVKIPYPTVKFGKLQQCAIGEIFEWSQGCVRKGDPWMIPSSPRQNPDDSGWVGLIRPTQPPPALPSEPIRPR